ncbi:cleavage and polyadenylation specificity factor subunit 6-like isoform X1 [Penaeus indicus]|uniref:cleavage and polyadenylation specificity factor subunit 6-like isoform X1 n=1 Tax=Penaeus indicus TaxID=29960 RepID=UPI00300D2F9E
MAEVDIDLYGDVEQDFTQDDFADGDLYDAVLTGGGREREREAPPSPTSAPPERNGGTAPSRQPTQAQRGRSVSSEERAVFSGPVPHSGRKYQLYVGNLTWVSHMFL